MPPNFLKLILKETIEKFKKDIDLTFHMIQECGKGMYAKMNDMANKQQKIEEVKLSEGFSEYTDIFILGMKINEIIRKVNSL